MADLVLDLNDRRPIWALPPWAVERLRARLPPGWTLHAVSTPADGSGDGAGGGPSAEVLEAVTGARVYVGYGIPPQVLEAGRGTLRWVHTGTAGVGGSLHPTMRAAGIPFTNSAGVHGPPIAETVVGMVLHFLRGFHLALGARHGALPGEEAPAGPWDPSPFFAAGSPVREVSSARVGILGMGGIGEEVAWRLGALGAEVVGLRRSSGGGEGTGRPRWRASAPRGVPDAQREALLGSVRRVRTLPELLEGLDVLVVTAPETAETRGIVNAEALARLPRGALLVNVSRGSLVVEDALVAALRSGQLGGAGLDVFATEPLPAESPLWHLPNVLVTPHVSGVSQGFWERQVALVAENLDRLLAGRPLLNEVELDRGY